MNFFEHIGRYAALQSRVFRKPEKFSMYWKQFMMELEKLGLNSVGIVLIISIFMGGVLVLQISYNLTNPLMPIYLIGLGTRDTLILEFSSTMLCLILAGKVGSNIATEIGSMRVSEQIDSLEIMGINSASFLILPKVLAVVFMSPFLFVLSVAMGLIGGAIAGPLTGAVTIADYFEGLTYMYEPFYVTFSIVKTFAFGFLIASVPSYYGYYVTGGALDVGKQSTISVVNTSILILFSDLIITQLFFK